MTLADTQVVLDISHHQDRSLDLAQCRRDGVAAVLLKAGEGNTFVDPEFAANLAEARAAGLLVGAYWYVRSAATAAQHVAAIKRVVPAGMVVIPDVESGSGGVGLVREIVRLLLAAGYRVPWTYLPRWYWQQIGSPSLAGLPPLWSSRYPDNVVGTLAEEWADVPASYWAGYGGLSVGLLQFTSSARIAGYQPLDASAFRGTYTQLAAQFGGTTQEDGPVKNLILAREKGGTGVWVGDGVTRRHIEDELELKGLQFWIGQKGGDPNIVFDWQDLRVLGVDVSGLLAPLADDESKVIAAVQAMPTGGQVDVPALATALASLGTLVARVPDDQIQQLLGEIDKMPAATRQQLAAALAGGTP